MTVTVTVTPQRRGRTSDISRMHEMSIENGDIFLRICCFLIMLRGGETQKKVNQNKTVGDSLTTATV